MESIKDQPQGSTGMLALLRVAKGKQKYGGIGDRNGHAACGFRG